MSTMKLEAETFIALHGGARDGQGILVARDECDMGVGGKGVLGGRELRKHNERCHSVKHVFNLPQASRIRVCRLIQTSLQHRNDALESLCRDYPFPCDGKKKR